MTQIHWSNQVSADFNTAADWSTAAVPGAKDDAILDAAGATAYTVTVSTNERVRSIQTASTATLSITVGKFTATAGTGLGANAGAIIINNNTSLAVGGGLNNSGLISLNNTSGNGAKLFLNSNTVLSGAGQVTLGDNAKNFIFGASAAVTLTNVDNTISGGGRLGNGSMTLVNQLDGVIDATGSNALILNTTGHAVVNGGLLEASGPAGLTILTTTVDSSTGGVIEANTGSMVTLSSADIIGGTLETDGTGQIVATGRASLIDGTTSTVHNSGALNVANNSWLTAQGTVDNSGQISVLSAGNDTRLIVGAAGLTLSGGGTLTIFGNTGAVTGVTASATLTNVDNTIIANGQLGKGALTLVNEVAGVIDSTSTFGLVLNTGAQAVTNAGLIEASARGLLTIQGTTVDDSTGGVIAGYGAGSVVNLSSAHIIGGTLAGSGGVVETASGNRGGVIDGTTSTVHNIGQLNVTNGAWLTVQGALDNSGQISATSTGADTRLIVGAAGLTLSGGGSIFIPDTSGAGAITGATASATLTNVDNTIAVAGQLGNGKLTLINEVAGVIDSTSVIPLVLDTGANTVINAGLIEAIQGGVLTIQSTTVDDSTGGVVQAADANSVVYLSSAHIIGGTLATSGGGVIETAANNRHSIIDGVTSMVSNQANLEVTSNAWLTVQGALDNIGQITLSSVASDDVRLIVGAAGLTLSGGGVIDTSENLGNAITGATAAATLTNVDNRLLGGGRLGNGQMTLINEAAGVIEATGAAARILDTGANTITNDGLLEASGSGGLTIANSTVDNSGGGVIQANGGVVNLSSARIVGGALSGVIETAAGDQGSEIDGATSAVSSSGTIHVGDNAWLTVQGAVDNTGYIGLLSNGGDTRLIIGAAGLTLSGGGLVDMSENVGCTVTGVSATATLTNVDNTIYGNGGRLGNGQMTLVNQAAGRIALFSGLTIDTGANIVVNAGIIEAKNDGGLIMSAVDNTGVLRTNGGDLIVDGAVTGTGSAVITGATLEFGSSFTENVAFTSNSGGLQLAQSQGYTGAISGFSLVGGTSLDLRDIGYAGFVSAGGASFSGTSVSGVLTVTDGVHTANITLIGDYTTSSFTGSDDGHGGVIVVDPPRSGGAVAAPLPVTAAPANHGFVAAMAALGGAAGAVIHAGEAWAVREPVLVNPRGRMA